MAKISASRTLVVVDNQIGESTGTTNISYEKQEFEEYWERRTGTSWERADMFVLVPNADAESQGTYTVTLAPGEFYEAGVFAENAGPITDPQLLATIKVFALWRQPAATRLISDENAETGGTFHNQGVFTLVPTNIVALGVKRSPFDLDGDGLPIMVDTEGGPLEPLSMQQNHPIEILPLLPGQHYWLGIVVADEFGNWEVMLREFDTQWRRLTVQFKTLHIYNDGDPGSYGEGEFWFAVYFGLHPGDLVQIEEFYRPEADIDDWSETDRPYPLGFTHVGVLRPVLPEEREISVRSWGVEHDGAFEADEAAWSSIRSLSLPVGSAGEIVTNRSFLLQCPTVTVDDDFRYGVDIVWSVDYDYPP